MTKYKVQIVIEDFVEIDHSFNTKDVLKKVFAKLLENVLSKRFIENDLFLFEFAKVDSLAEKYQKPEPMYYMYNMGVPEAVRTRGFVPLKNQMKSNGH